MRRLRDIPETCPIYKEAENESEMLIERIHEVLNPNITQDILHHIKVLLECVDRCRDISGQLREICVERGERIESLENEILELNQES